MMVSVGHINITENCCVLLNSNHYFSDLGAPLAASGFTVLLITIERYIIITNPYHGAHLLHNAMRYATVISTWALSLVCMVMIPYVWINADRDLKDSYYNSVSVPLSQTAFNFSKLYIFSDLIKEPFNFVMSMLF